MLTPYQPWGWVRIIGVSEVVPRLVLGCLTTSSSPLEIRMEHTSLDSSLITDGRPRLASRRAPLLLTIEQVQEQTGLGRSTLYRLMQRNALPGVVHVGRAVRVRAADLEEWVVRLAGSAA